VSTRRPTRAWDTSTGGVELAWPKVLDSIKDLVQRRFKVRWVAAQLREQGAALNRSQKGNSQATRVGLAPEIP
jgi:hypothetical protein